MGIIAPAVTPQRKLLPENSIAAGDVLLCYEDAKRVIGNRIKKVTASDYTHAAICIGGGIAAESVRSGLATVTIRELVERYNHVAVFRQPLWTAPRLEELASFVQTAIGTNAKYNVPGILAFVRNRDAHQDSLHEQLTRFFDGDLEPVSPDRDRYFCSEFIAACLIKVGIIDQSAAIVYRPETMSPGDLGRDPTFGTFAGYVSARKDCVIPPEDEFYNATTFDEIYSKD